MCAFMSPDSDRKQAAVEAGLLTVLKVVLQQQPVQDAALSLAKEVSIGERHISMFSLRQCGSLFSHSFDGLHVTLQLHN